MSNWPTPPNVCHDVPRMRVLAGLPAGWLIMAWLTKGKRGCGEGLANIFGPLLRCSRVNGRDRELVLVGRCRCSWVGGWVGVGWGGVGGGLSASGP